MSSILFAFLLWAFGSRRGGSSSTTPERLPPSPAPTPGGNTPPWPQVVPAGLPSFPGSGWQYDEPPPPAVQQRAGALVTPLWSGGAGTYKIEQTAGRWIAYRAEVVASGRKGVVAYRQRAAQPITSRPPARAPAAPAAGAPVASRPVSVPVAAPVAAVRVSPSSTMTLPLLKYGMGLKPAAPVPEVKLMQQRLGLVADGRFGNDTRNAVRKYQIQKGLQVDGQCGPETWGSLFASTSA